MAIENCTEVPLTLLSRQLVKIDEVNDLSNPPTMQQFWDFLCSKRIEPVIKAQSPVYKTVGDKDSFDIYDLTEATPGVTPDFQLLLDSE